ncbi:hypothetical protein LZ016_11370 [Sphingomonas sp. SM33]|uniref:Calcium-binding protein n=1 Tax=Sphingomonas telluris TaxID=2907998 RepID=A0ABS9VNY9_9SPHN|nr:calcium-binding protein [Sphingomonas telluris]MCH8616696.1 hypothetical protein [Sphingomonas telluris]
MPKPSPSLGPISIKGGKGADHIVIGESPYVYSTADQNRGFVIDGSNGDDVLAGGIGVDRISGGSGFDIIRAQSEDILGTPSGTAAYDGGLDRDILDFSLWTQGVAIDLGTTNISGDRDRFYTNFSMDSPTGLNIALNEANDLRGVTVSIEGLIGGSANDFLSGDWGANYIEGGAGDDYITGKRGDDRLIGGAGNDFILTGADTDLVSGGAGNDTLVLGGGTTGAYYVTTVDDFDTRAGDADASFDRIWINQDFDWHFEAAANGTLKIVYGVDYYPSPLGEVVLQGLTMANAADVIVQGFDPMTGMPG